MDASVNCRTTIHPSALCRRPPAAAEVHPWMGWQLIAGPHRETKLSFLTSCACLQTAGVSQSRWRHMYNPGSRTRNLAAVVSRALNRLAL